MASWILLWSHIGLGASTSEAAFFALLDFRQPEPRSRPVVEGMEEPALDVSADSTLETGSAIASSFTSISYLSVR